MAATSRYEIMIDARDEDGQSSSRFLFWARSGRAERTEAEALLEFDRVKRAMRGEDVGIFADHFMTATLLKGDSAEVSEVWAQEAVESYTREPA